MAQISSGAIFIRLEPFIGCPKCCLAKISWSFSGPLGPNWLQLSWWDSFQSLTHFEVKRAERRKKSKITSFQFRSIKNYQKPPKMRYTWVFFSVAGNRHPSSKCLLSPAMKNNIILSIYVPKQFHKFNHHMFQHHLQPFKPLFFELMLTPVLDMDWMLMITTTLLLKILDKLGIGELVIKILRSCFAPLAGMFLEILFMHQSLLFFQPHSFRHSWAL